MAKLALLKGAVPKIHINMLTRWGFNFFPSAFGTASKPIIEIVRLILKKCIGDIQCKHIGNILCNEIG